MVREVRDRSVRPRAPFFAPRHLFQPNCSLFYQNMQWKMVTQG